MRLLMICMISICLAGFCYAEDLSVGTIKNTENGVNITRGDDTIAASPGFKINTHDVIQTGKDGVAGIIFNDSTLVTLGEKSEMVVDEYLFQPKKKQYGFKMYLKSGSAIYSSGKLGKLSPESVKFKTPKATVGVRGTKFLVKVD